MASEKELNIKVNTQAELSSIQDLSNLLENIKSKVEELEESINNINFDGANIDGSDISDSFSDASSAVDGLAGSLNDVDGSGLDDVASMGSDVSDAMDGASSSVDDLAGSLGSIDSQVISQLTQEVEDLKNKLQETQQETENTTTTLDDLMGLVSNGAIVAGYKSMADSAGSYGDQMVKLGYAMSGTSMTVEQAEQTYGKMIKSMTTSTGRGAGAVRQHILNLANVGIKNNQILAESFEGVSKASFQMEKPIEQLDSAFQKMVLSGMAGKKQLANFGLAEKDLANAMGVSVDEATKKFKELDEESRASVLSSALNMKYGEEVNKNYENSYEHLMDTVDRAMDYLERLVGKVFLPYLVPAVETAVDGINFLANSFDSLPTPLKDAIGGIASVTAGFSLLAIAGSGAIRIGSAIITPYMKLGAILTGQNQNFNKFASVVIDSLSTAKSKIIEYSNVVKDKLSKLTFFNDEKGSLGGGQAKTFDTLKQKISTTMDTIKTKITTAFSTAKLKIVEFANTTKTTLISAFNNARAKAVSFASTLKTNLVGAFNTVKSGIITLASNIKTSLVSAFSTGIAKAKELALGLIDLGKKALISGYNALKSAGMWLVEKASLLANAVAKGVATVSSWALAVAEWAVASPIIIIIAIILILIGVLIYLYTTNESVRNAINGLGQTFVEIGQMIWDAMVNAYNTVVNFLMMLWQYIVSIGQMILQSVGISSDNITASILGFMVFMATLPLQIGIIFTNIIAKALGFGDNFAQRMFTAGANAVKRFIGQIQTAYNKLKTELSNMLSAVGEWAKTLPQKFWDAGVNAVKNFLSALGINSPGIMQRTLVWEINEMGNRVPKESKQVLTNINKLGTNIVDEFGNPTLETDYAINGEFLSQSKNNNNGEKQIFNINIEVGSVDNEERTDEIVNAIIRRLKFENSTAGRTV